MQGDESRVLSELFRVHTLQRTIYRRFVCALFLSIAGCASCMIKYVVADEGIGAAGFVISLFAAMALLLGLNDARDVRALQTRMSSLAGRMRDLHRREPRT